jgi:hypothetical protein
MRTDSKKLVGLVQTAAGPLRISILAFIFALGAPDEKAHLIEVHLQKTGTVALSETDGRGVPLDDLQPNPGSDGGQNRGRHL